MLVRIRGHGFHHIHCSGRCFLESDWITGIKRSWKCAFPSTQQLCFSKCILRKLETRTNRDLGIKVSQVLPTYRERSGAVLSYKLGTSHVGYLYLN